jgi:hypothetical protein
MVAMFSIQDVEQKQLFYKLSNALSLDSNAVLGQKISGVYAIYNGDTCLYVGLSTNIPSRLATHLRGKYSECTHIEFYKPDDCGFDDFYKRKSADQKVILENGEKQLMANLKPIDNLAINMDFTLPNEQEWDFNEFTPIKLQTKDTEDGKSIVINRSGGFDVIETDYLNMFLTGSGFFDGKVKAKMTRLEYKEMIKVFELMGVVA